MVRVVGTTTIWSVGTSLGSPAFRLAIIWVMKALLYGPLGSFVTLTSGVKVSVVVTTLLGNGLAIMWTRTTSIGSFVKPIATGVNDEKLPAPRALIPVGRSAICCDVS